METTSTALATREQMNEIASIDPATAWLYQGGKRLAINNDTRNGFVIKAGGEAVEELKELRAQITNATSLHSHRQPGEKDKDKPRHADNVEWCESTDNKTTSTSGVDCSACAARDECKWKIELTMILDGRDDEYKLTIPTASAMRFKQAVQKLSQLHHIHFMQAYWLMWVTVEKSNGNAFPVVNYKVFDTGGNELPLDSGNGNGAPKQAAPAPTPAPQAKQLPVRQPAAKFAVANGFDFKEWATALAAEEPYYNDPHAPQGVVNPALYHIQGTIRKVGYGAISDNNADEIKYMLLEYAKNAREEPKQAS